MPRRLSTRAGVAAGAALFAAAGLVSILAQAPPPGRQTLPASGRQMPSPSRAQSSRIRFTDVTQGSGLRSVHASGGSGHGYYVEQLGSGAAFLDYDGDGTLDVFLAGGGTLPGYKGPPPAGNKLFRNNGNGTFTDVTRSTGLATTQYTLGAAAADYDNDGHTDLYITTLQGNALFHNDGTGHFTNVTAAAGVAARAMSTGAAFFDYDGDGLLDLFVSRYMDYSLDADKGCQYPAMRRVSPRVQPPAGGRGGIPESCGPLDYPPTTNRLFSRRFPIHYIQEPFPHFTMTIAAIQMLLSAALALQGTAHTTTLRGVVRDEMGGVIAAASVEVTCGADRRRVSTDGAGEFVVVDLPVAQCTVSAESALFAPASAAVDLARTSSIALTLPVRGFATSVVVTPTRGVRESTFDVPASVSVITREDLDGRPVTLLPLALRQEPGILVQQTTTAQASPVIRGFTGQGIAYLIDGVRLNTTSWRGGPSQYLAWVNGGAANRIEIVRGPGSVEYGSDALGGTINVMTQAPAFSQGGVRVGGEVSATLGSAERTAGTDAAFTIQGRAAAFRIGVSRQQVGNLRAGRGIDSHAAVTRFLGVPSDVSGTRMPHTGFDQTGGFLTGSIRAGSKGSIKTMYLHDRQDGVSRYDRIEGGDGLYRSGFEPQQLDFALVRYQRTGLRALDDASATVSINRQGEGRFEQTRPTAVLDRQQSTTTALGYQLDGHRRLGSRHQLGLGTEIYRESIDAFREQVTPATGMAVPNRPDIPDGTRYVNAGVFVNDSAVIMPGRLTVRGGLRYGRFAFSTVADPLMGVGDERVSMQAVTFNSGLLLSITRNLNATFGVARGFRAASSADLGSIGLSGGGGFGITPSRAGALGGLVGSTGAVGAVSTGQRVPALGPEVVYSFEPGLKFQASRVSATFAAYDMESLDTIQRRAVVFDRNVVGMTIAGYQIVRQDAEGLAYIAQDIRPIGTNINADHARIRGFDAAGTVDLGRGWTTRAYFSMTNGRLLATGEYLRRMPPPLGGASVRWAAKTLWIEGTTMIAGAQSRFNSGDLTDARIGATRTRTSIANYFNGTATDLGMVKGGILQATGETLAQVQTRVLGNSASAPLFEQAPGFVVFGLRGGVRVSDAIDFTLIGENLSDRNYRVYGSGVDSPGINVQLRARYRF